MKSKGATADSKPRVPGRAQAHDFVLACVFALLSFACYAFTSARYVLGGDNAEFLALAQGGGVAHPSGYPLYVLYLRAATLIPIEPVLSASLATALLGAAANAGLYLAVRRWGARPLSASVVTLLFALSPRAWIASTHAEVFALNALIASVLLLLCAPESPSAAADNSLAANVNPKHVTRQIALLGLTAGLGLSNHLTCVLLAPLGIAAALSLLGEGGARGLRLVVGLAGLCLGLCPYLSLLRPVPADAAWSWGYPETLQQLFAHVARADYGVLQLGPKQEPALALTSVWIWLQTTLSDLVYLPLLLCPLGLLALKRRGARSLAFFPRYAAWIALATVFSCGPLLISQFSLNTEATGLSVMQRFFLLPELLLCWLAALGLSLIEERVGPYVTRNHTRLATVLLCLVIPLVQVLRVWDELAEHHSAAVQRYLENTLRSCPSGCIILGTGDHRLFGFAYLQGVAQLRSDVTYVDPILLHYSWYRERVGRQLGARLAAPANGSVNTVTLSQQLLDLGRPLFLSNVFTPYITRTFPNYPLGTLIRVLPRGSAPPSTQEVVQLNRDLLDQFTLDYPEPADPHSWAWRVHQEYSRPWEALRGAGSTVPEQARFPAHAR